MSLPVPLTLPDELLLFSAPLLRPMRPPTAPWLFVAVTTASDMRPEKAELLSL